MNALHVAERSAVYALEDAVTPVAGETFDLLATAPQGVAKLRELILSSAVAGRLVPHDQDDEPATDLLQRIYAEKRRRVELGELSPRALRNTSAERDTPNAPENWAWSSLGQIGIINPRNSAPDDTLASFAPMTVIPISMRGRLHTEERKWADIKSGFTHFAEGDVGVAKITPCFQNGKSVVFRDLVNGIGAGTTELHVVRPLCGVVPEYILVFLKSPVFLMNGEAEMTGTAGQRRLPRTYFEDVPFPLPPLAEQHRIVARVEELMGLCDELETHCRLQDEQHTRLVAALFDALVASTSPTKLADNWQRIANHFDLLLDRPEAVDALEQTVLQLAVRGLLVPQDPADEPASALLTRILEEKSKTGATTRNKRETTPSSSEDAGAFTLPAGWAWAHFVNLGEFGRGKSKHRPRNDPRLFNPGIYPLIQTGEVSRAGQFIEEIHSYYSEDGLAQSKLWPKGTLCITIAANIADSAMLKFEACFPDSVVGFVPSPILGDARFFHMFMSTARQRLIDFAPATAQKNINLEVLNSLRVPVPPVVEMHRIVARVEELRGLCADLRQQLQQSQTTQSNLADALVARAAT